MVREAIGQLPARCREMIELLFFEHPPVPYTEVARRLNLATGSIGFIRGRCLKRLKKAVGREGILMPESSGMPGLDELLANLAQEPNARRRRQLLQSRADLCRPDTVTRLYDEVVRLLQVDIQQAERMARAAWLLAGRLGDDASRAAGLRALGHVHYRRRKYEKSLDLYQESLAIYQRLGDALEAGRTLNSSLQSLIYLGRYPEAMDYAEQARQIFERLGDRLRLARLDANMGNILYRQDRFEEALELYLRAYDAFLRSASRRMSPSRSRTWRRARSA